MSRRLIIHGNKEQFLAHLDARIRDHQEAKTRASHRDTTRMDGVIEGLRIARKAVEGWVEADGI